jgi:beta-lactamase class A
MEAASLTRRLKGNLPESVRVFHKTGTSGVHNGLAPATNDIGLVELPDGKRLAIAVFVTDSRADEATRERVIAEIGRAAYDAAR